LTLIPVAGPLDVKGRIRCRSARVKENKIEKPSAPFKLKVAVPAEELSLK
jgi:hypothetical protein